VLLVAAEIAPPAARPGRCEDLGGVRRAAAGRRAQRLCGGEQRRRRGRARSAERELIWSRLSERSARSKRSEFRDPAPQPSSAAQSDQREDRRSEAEHAARPRLGARRSYAD
jgi:hypothetical protein